MNLNCFNSTLKNKVIFQNKHLAYTDINDAYIVHKGKVVWTKQQSINLALNILYVMEESFIALIETQVRWKYVFLFLSDEYDCVCLGFI